MDVNLDGPVPRYLQIAELLRDRITSGEYAAHQRLPSESFIVQEAGVSRETARKAIAVLREEGLVYTVQAMGTFVSPQPPG